MDQIITSPSPTITPTAERTPHNAFHSHPLSNIWFYLFMTFLFKLSGELMTDGLCLKWSNRQLSEALPPRTLSFCRWLLGLWGNWCAGWSLHTEVTLLLSPVKFWSTWAGERNALGGAQPGHTNSEEAHSEWKLNCLKPNIKLFSKIRFRRLPGQWALARGCLGTQITYWTWHVLNKSS